MEEGAVHEIAMALRFLGMGDAATTMGAIELLSREIKEGSERIADRLNRIAEAIEDMKEA
jgi:hypothetical protein